LSSHRSISLQGIRAELMTEQDYSELDNRIEEFGRSVKKLLFDIDMRMKNEAEIHHITLCKEMNYNSYSDKRDPRIHRQGE
jgi:hypothetical protein